MKPANPAPLYACLYPALCDLARGMGYALAIHGTVSTDFDLIAAPWVESAAPPEELYLAMKERLGAMDFRELLTRDLPSLPPEQIERMVSDARRRDPRGVCNSSLKPHGRIAFNLYLDHGCKVDLSIMPRK